MEDATVTPVSKKNVKPTILRPSEEMELLRLVIQKAQSGEEVTRQDVIDEVVKYLKSDNRKNRFRNGTPGDKWFSLFRRRHNSHFKSLDPKVIRNLEKVGFTERVTHTMLHLYTKSASKRSSLATARHEPRPASPCSDESDNEEQDNMANQESQPADSSDFHPGNKLEVMDFNNKWYPVKIVEVDYEEGEVLVHFEKWSDKYDEWVRMDSNRIRKPMLPQGPSSKKIFEKDEKVIATWAYNHKYPAVIREVLPNDKYEVLFMDGYAKILRGCKLFKATEEDLKNYKLPPPKKPAPPMGADPLDPNLGPKEERRLKKRRLDVLESYLPTKKFKSDCELSPQASSSEKQKAKLKGRFSLPLQKKPIKQEDSELNRSYEDEDDDNYDNYIDEGVDDSESDGKEDSYNHSEEKVVKRRRRRSKPKKVFDEANYHYRPRMRSAAEENPERWTVELPPNALPVKITGPEGKSRTSIVVPDRNLPAGWTKHTMRRNNDTKWDVFLVNSEGRKFRSRNELRSYYSSELKQPFPEESFDFQVGRKMEIERSQVWQDNLRSKSPSSPKNYFQPVKRRRRRRAHSVEESTVHEGESKVNTSQKSSTPKSQQSESEKENPSNLSTPPFPLSDMRTPDGGFTCCGKNFRKENLFQMHMKHYHPEYSSMFGSTPNVADLAYARTVGEPIEDSRGEIMSPKSSVIERKPVLDTLISPDAASKGTKIGYDKEATASHKIKSEKPSEAPLDQQPSVKEEENDTSVSKKSKEEKKAVEKSEGQAADNKKSLVESELASVKESAENNHESITATSGEKSTSSEDQSTAVVSQSTPSTPSSTTGSMPVIKHVSKQTPKTTEAMIVQTTLSEKKPITITKCMPPGLKSVIPLTKVTISMTATSPTITVTPSSSHAKEEKEKEPSVPTAPKTTIKTLLPMRPPKEPAEPKEPLEPQKFKDVKSKEQEVEEETPTKSRSRKRTASETSSKKSKPLKHSTGSLEDELREAVMDVAEPLSTKNGNTSYRFSRYRSQTQPRVSLEKLNITPDSNGIVNLGQEKDLATAEGEKVDKPSSNMAGAGRRRVKSFKAANKINRRLKDIEAADNIDQLGNDNNTTTFKDNNNLSLQDDAACDSMRKEEIINCTCGYMEEDGLMIQCDLCLCWQHGMCNNIDKESDVPEKYVCYMCLNPARQRASMKHIHNQDWLKEGKLPTLSFQPTSKEDIEQKQTMLKKSHDLTSSLLELRTVIRSLRVKTHIATKPDHPKLYLWAKSWKSDNTEQKQENQTQSKPDEAGPQPEVAIDETECRLRLLEHVEDYQQQVDDRLTSIQAQIAALEAEDPDLASDESSDQYPVTKQTVQMILRDLGTVQKIASLN